MASGFMNPVKRIVAKIFNKESKKVETKVIKKPEDRIKEEKKIEIPKKDTYTVTKWKKPRHSVPLFYTQILKKKRDNRKILARLQKKSRSINHRKAA